MQNAVTFGEKSTFRFVLETDKEKGGRGGEKAVQKKIGA